MKIYMEITAKDAIKAGNTRSGKLGLEVDELWFAGLSQERRDVLAEMLQEFNGGILIPPAPGAAEVTSDTINAAITHEIDRRAKEKEQIAKQDADRAAYREEQIKRWLALPPEQVLKRHGNDPYYPAVDFALTSDPRVQAKLTALKEKAKQLTEEREAKNKAEIDRAIADWIAHPTFEAVGDFRPTLGSMYGECLPDYKEIKAKVAEIKAQAKAQAAQFAEHLDCWLGEHGTTSQRLRRKQGFMPDDEILKLVRDQLFQPFDEYPRFAPLKASDVDHSCEGQGEVNFSSCKPERLTDAEFSLLCEMRRTLNELHPGTDTVETRLHVAECSSSYCPDVAVSKSALVTIDWHGRKLSREYSLEV